MIVRNPKELGHLVRDHRSRKRLTQAHLAFEVGVSRKWIIDLEAGKRTTDLSLVLRTLNVLGVELDARNRSRRQAKYEAYDIDAIVEEARRGRR
ncbi:MAG: helix-turn-helix domain-containing protein [Gemmatimonadaceae bacterium]